jgi:hypothetical protein
LDGSIDLRKRAKARPPLNLRVGEDKGPGWDGLPTGVEVVETGTFDASTVRTGEDDEALV